MPGPSSYTLLGGETTFKYTVTASSEVGDHTFFGHSEQRRPRSGDGRRQFDTVTVTQARTPDPTPDAGRHQRRTQSDRVAVVLPRVGGSGR